MSEFLTEKTLKLFIDESKSYIETLNKDLITVEEKNADKSVLERISRAVHTLKGSSGLLGFNAISNISHKIEDYLQKINNSFPQFNQNHLEQVFSLVDKIDKLIDEIAEGDFKNAQNGNIEEISGKEIKTEIEHAKKLNRISLLQVIRGIDEDLLPRMLNMLQAVENMILILEDTPQDEALLARIFDSISYLYRTFSSIGMSQPLSLLFLLRELMTSLKSKNFKINKEIIDLLFRTISSVKSTIENYQQGTAFPVGEMVSEYRELLQNSLQDKSVITVESANEVFKRLTISAEFKDYFDTFEKWRICKEKIDGKNVFEINVRIILPEDKLGINLIEFMKPLGERILFCLVLEKPDARGEVMVLIYVVSETYDEVTEGFDFFREVGNILIKQVGIETSLEPIEHKEKQLEAKPTASTVKEKLIKQTIRVDADKLDNLMNLIAELVIIKNRLSQDVKKLKDNVSFIEPLMESVQKLLKEAQIYLDEDDKSVKFSYSEMGEMKSQLIKLKEFYKKLIRDFNQTDFNIGRISDELQDETMKARMIPISQVFGKFPRKVRDIAKQLNKKIDFIMEGEETKLDKTLVEELEEPILHLVRNSIDHGIESIEERIKKGKSEVGTIKLKAYYEGNSVIVRVDDDGQGIDLQKIKSAAINKGLITAKEAETLDETQIRNLIFTPNFSTAEKVTELSGRGVGMDVVKAKMADLKGIIDIYSEIGKWTTFKLKLPLTISIIQALVVICNGFKYVIPIEPIISSSIIWEDQIYMVEGKEVVQDSGRVFPVVRLRRVFYEDVDYITQDKCAILIMELGNKKFGLVVDELIGKQQVVIKSLGELLKNVKYISGATIFGDGSIALIVDVGGISIDISTLSKIDVSRRKEKVKIILIVDDSRVSGKSHKDILERAGFRVHTATSAVEAFEKMKVINYDLIITDVQMPKIDGYNFTAKIRGLEEFKKVPIIMVTSDKEKADKTRGFQVGVNEYLIKPYSDEELKRTVKKYI